MSNLIEAIKHRIQIGGFFTDAIIAFITCWVIIGLVKIMVWVF